MSLTALRARVLTVAALGLVLAVIAATHAVSADSETTTDPSSQPPVAQCADSLDNDSDGVADLSDPDCSAPDDDSEASEQPTKPEDQGEGGGPGSGGPGAPSQTPSGPGAGGSAQPAPAGGDLFGQQESRVKPGPGPAPTRVQRDDGHGQDRCREDPGRATR